MYFTHVESHADKKHKEAFHQKQEEKVLDEPAAMYKFNDVVIVILNGLISGL